MEITKIAQNEVKCIAGRMRLKSLTGNIIKMTATDRCSSNIELNLNIPKSLNELSERPDDDKLHYGDLLSFFDSYPVEIYLFRFGKDIIPEDILTGSFNNEWDNIGSTICEISEEKYGNLKITVKHPLLHVAGQQKKTKLYLDEKMFGEQEHYDILSIPVSILHSYFPEIHLGDILIVRIKRENRIKKESSISYLPADDDL